MNQVEFVKENNNIPFPQANSFYRVLDLVNELNNQELSASDIADVYEFDIRQANYYLAAAQYLGLVIKDKNYKLSELGKQIMKMNHKNKNLAIISIILSHKPFYCALEQYLTNFEFDYSEIAKVIYENRDEINSIGTAERRTSTVVAWVKWIMELTTIFERNPFDK